MYVRAYVRACMLVYVASACMLYPTRQYMDQDPAIVSAINDNSARQEENTLKT